MVVAIKGGGIYILNILSKDGSYFRGMKGDSNDFIICR